MAKFDEKVYGAIARDLIDKYSVPGELTKTVMKEAVSGISSVQ